MPVSDDTTGRFGWRLLAGAAIVGALLRFAGIEAKSLWGDEIVNLTVSMGHSWYPWQGEETALFYSARHYRDQVALAPQYFSGRLPELLRMNDQMPPLYYVLLNLWLHAFGTSEAALRSLSLLASVATMPLLYLLGATLSSRRVGAYTAWLFAVAPFPIAFAVYNRPYAWLCFFAVLSTLAAVRLSRGERGKWLVVYAAAGLLGLYTHYLFLWNLLFQIVLVSWHLRRDRAGLLRFGLACLAAAAGFSLWAPTFLAQVEWSRQFGHQSWFYWYSGLPHVSHFVTSLGRNLLLLLTAGRVTEFCGGSDDGSCRIDLAMTLVSYGVPLAILALVGWRVLQHIGRVRGVSEPAPDRWATCLLWAGFVFIGPVISDVLLNSHMVFSHRYFIAASGPVYLAVAMAVVGSERRVARWSVGAGLLLFLVVGSGLYLRGSAPALMYEIAVRDVARYLDDRSEGVDDLILVPDPGLNPMDFAYYLRSNPDFARIAAPDRHESVPDVPTQLQAIANARPRTRIWYMDDHGPEKTAHNAALGWLRTQYSEVEVREFTNLRVFLFSPREQLGARARTSRE